MPSLMRCINIISRCGAIYRSDRLAGTDLGETHHSYILTLCRSPGISQDSLSKKLFINNTLITAASKNSPLRTELDSIDIIHLSHEQAHSFSIEYSVIQPGDISSIDYQVKLDGYDRNWRNKIFSYQKRVSQTRNR